MAASPLPKPFPPPRHRFILLLLLLLLIAIISLSTSIPTISSQSDDNTYIVHMDFKAMPKPYTNHHTWFIATLSTLPPPSTHIYTYTNSIHGFAAKLTPSQLQSIKTLPGYIFSTQDRQLHLHTTHSPKFLGLDSLHASFPATNHGRDVIIGVIDTGIWPESESFRDDGMTRVPTRWKGKCVFNSSLCNKKLVGAYFYNKGLLASLRPNVSVNDEDSPRDTDGHGTHTASTAAGNYVTRASYFGYAPGTARGVAPRARVAVYKAAWDLGIYSSDVIAAVDRAIEDRVDVLSISLGLDLYSTDLVEDVIATATFAAVERGIFVAASAGNLGPQYATVINGAPWLTTVGAGGIDRRFGGVLSLGDGKKENAKTVPFFSLYAGDFSTKARGMVFLDGCGSIDEMARNRDKIIVCTDNSSVFTQEQNENARTANATVVFITATEVPFYYMRNFIPSAYVDLKKHGKIVMDYLKSSKSPRGSLTFRKTTIGSKPEPRIDEFSAKGPTPICPSVLKPDVIAPGSLILASWSPISPVAEVLVRRQVFSPFKIMSGTSMAASHVAGVAALIKNVHPDWSPAAIRSALMTTASSVDNAGEQIRDASNYTNPADSFGFGSGHIKPIAALDPGLIYDATTDDYVSLLCAMNFTTNQIRAVTRRSAHQLCGNKSSKAVVVDLNYPSFVAYFNDYRPGSEPKVVVHEFRRIVTNVGRDGVASYTAKLTPMKGVAVKVEPEKLVFKKKYEKLSYKLTVTGPKLLNETVVQGSLSWVHDGGKYLVRSPIVATSLTALSPFSDS